MHEYSIVRALLDRVEDSAKEHSAVAVHSIRVRIGELAGVEPDLFTSAFDLCRPSTLCAEARLEVVNSPAAWNCPGCDSPIDNGEVLSCPTCRLPARMTAGDEILLERIEMEVT